MLPTRTLAITLCCLAPELAAQSAVQDSYIKASNPGFDDEFGASVSLSSDTLVVGAYREDSNATGVGGDQNNNGVPDSGAAYVFVRGGDGSWTQQAYLKASNTGADDYFGWAVAVSGDTLVVGAYQEDSNATGVDGDQNNNGVPDSGAAYVFVRNGSSWMQQAYLKASNTGLNDGFGRTVAISGDTIVVGAPGENGGQAGINPPDDNSRSNAGAAYVFVRNGTTWSEQAYLKASNPTGQDFFGTSVSVSGDTILVGAPLEDSAATGINGDQGGGTNGSGAAYAFVRSGTTWTQQAYIKASNTAGGDFFGSAVAIDGNTAVVTADEEASDATGVNGDQSNDDAHDSGAAYVFVRDGTIWSQQAYLKASNTDSSDNFGNSAAISGDVILIGARQEDSASLGINGDESDNSQSNVGAAYVFVRDGASWLHPIYLKPSNTASGFAFQVAASGTRVAVGAFRESGIETRSGATYVFDVDPDDLGRSGCFGEGKPTLSSSASSSGFEVDCPELSHPCFVGRILLFGACDRTGIGVPPPLGCDPSCLLVLSNVWGNADRLVVGPGLLPGFEFCVQCGCVASPSFLCVNLSEGKRIVVESP